MDSMDLVADLESYDDFNSLKRECGFILLPSGAVMTTISSFHLVEDYKDVILELCRYPEERLPAIIETEQQVIYIPRDQEIDKIKLLITDFGC